MVRGFKDDSGKFHPISQSKGVRKSRSKVRYANGAGSAQEATQQAKDFSQKIRDRYNKFKAEQDEEFNREVAIRRKFGAKLIDAYRNAKKQQVKSGRDLEKFIRQRIPDLPKDKKTNRFVVNILKDFKKTEQELEKKKKGKSEDEKKALQQDFEDALNESKILFIKQQGEQDKKATEEIKKREAEFKEKLAKEEKEAREAQEAREKAEKDEEERKQKEKEAKEAEEKAKKDAEEAERKEKEEASKAQQEEAERKQKESEEAEAKAQKEQQEAEKQAEESAKQAEKKQKEAEELQKELKKDASEPTQKDFDFGFPTEIV